MKKLFLTLSVAILMSGCSRTEQSVVGTSDVVQNDVADTEYTNGKIYTVNEAQTWAEAVAIKDGELLKVGSAEEVAAVAAVREAQAGPCHAERATYCPTTFSRMRSRRRGRVPLQEISTIRIFTHFS